MDASPTDHFNKNNLVVSGEKNFADMPSNFVYPETNMALTCNYFGANDYTRKQTIKDIKMKVIEERSTRK